MNDFMGMRLNAMSNVEMKKSAGALRIEPVDNWHGAWPQVWRAVEEQGKIKKLAVDADGWLSARQVLMVAFVGDTPAAHVCFGVSPGKTGCIEALLVSHGIDPKFCGRGIESQLHRAVVERAQALRCETLRGFRLSSKWC
jgi:hypothetical protein